MTRDELQELMIINLNYDRHISENFGTDEKHKCKRERNMSDEDVMFIIGAMLAVFFTFCFSLYFAMT